MSLFRGSAQEDRPAAARCEDCGVRRFPTHQVCSNCLSTRAEWVRTGGGEIFSFDIMHQVYHPAFAADVLCAADTVRLKDGPQVVSNLVGVKPREIECGVAVEVVFERWSGQTTLPKLRLHTSS